MDINQRVPRLVDVLPNGPRHHPTVQVFLAGGVPEVMLHLRRLGLLEMDALTVTGATVGRISMHGSDRSVGKGFASCYCRKTECRQTT
jgi:dihydroxyacid dehydratase/phosphogluconate dehydratase